MLALLVNPVGYLGGTGDDVHYLAGARCWVAQGSPCLPTDHWMARWPVVAPIALASHWLGESRGSIGLGSIGAWVMAIVLAGWLGRLWFDRLAGLIAAAVLAATPIFTQAALQPGADIPELMFQLAALVAATLAYRSGSKGAAIVAGGLAALAVQTRETSLLFCAAALLGWLLLDRGRRKILLWSVLGFGGASLAEAAVYYACTGDALYRFHLALHHAGIVSQELPANFDTKQSPILNPAYIKAWRREMGVRWWWPLDPWLNLVVNPRLGLMLVGAALLGITQWRRLDGTSRSLLKHSILLAGLVVILLVYGLAVDPKARMFLLAAAVAALIVGACTSAALRKGDSRIALLEVGLLIATGMFTLSQIPQTRDFEAQAERWMACYPGRLSVDTNVKSTLALVPNLGDLPQDPASRPFRMAGGTGACSTYGGVTIAQSAEVGSGRLCLLDMRADSHRR